MENQKTGKPVVTAAVVILVVALVAFVVARANNNGVSESMEGTDAAVVIADTPTLVVTESAPMPDTVPTAQLAESTAYKNGTYTVNGEYTSPAGKEEVGVTVTVTDDVITDVSVTAMATVPISIKYQADFAANYKAMVVGKKLDEVNLSKVSGSSLTPKGFNDAIEKIKLEAAA